VKVNSIQFLVFFPVVAFAFYLLPPRWRWVLLLGASFLFYLSWDPQYIVVLLTVTAIGYLGGLWLIWSTRLQIRRAILMGSLLAILGILFVFKNFNLSNYTLHAVLDHLGISSDLYLVLPLGISFFTLQTISYMVDVYRGVTKPEKHPGIYALFIAFFPHLTAGPIARANQLLPQLRTPHAPEYERIVSGLLRMAWGFFKKLVIADRLALLVNSVYGDPTAYTGIPLILATYAFAFQIYCDFSGYADIALGAASVLGINLQENFQQPYYARSILDFWRRWHITLYTWLRDYIFYPLTRIFHRSRMGSAVLLSLVLPPIVTMLASGLWHGNQWTFIIWGALHGLYMACSVLLNRGKIQLQLPFRLPDRIATGLRIFATFHLVSFAWIFFRANSLPEAVYIVRNLFVNLELRSSLMSMSPGGWYELSIALVGILMMEIVHWLQRRHASLRVVIRSQPAWLRWSVYYGLVVVIFIFGKFETAEFIYSRF